MRISDWSSDVCSSDLHFRLAVGKFTCSLVMLTARRLQRLFQIGDARGAAFHRRPFRNERGFGLAPALLGLLESGAQFPFPPSRPIMRLIGRRHRRCRLFEIGRASWWEGVCWYV